MRRGFEHVSGCGGVQLNVCSLDGAGCSIDQIFFELIDMAVIGENADEQKNYDKDNADIQGIGYDKLCAQAFEHNLSLLLQKPVTDFLNILDGHGRVEIAKLSS